MYFAPVLCAIFIFVSHVTARGYGMGGGGGGGMYGGGMYGGGSGGMYGGGSGGMYGGSPQGNYPPKPYDFGYQAPDESGNKHYRKEQGDGSGNVQGSYGYMDNQGLYRQVDYIANKGGFKASVKTNEPGTDGKEDPADVQMNVEQPPRGIQEKYSRMSSGGYGGGSHGGMYGGGYGGMGGQSKMNQFGGGYGMGGGSGMFSGIPRSSSGKSGY